MQKKLSNCRIYYHKGSILSVEMSIYFLCETVEFDHQGVCNLGIIICTYSRLANPQLYPVCTSLVGCYFLVPTLHNRNELHVEGVMMQGV